MADPKRLGKYEIIEEIGRGGFAVVYKARDTKLDRIVALKVLYPYWTADPGFAARFQREARTVSQLRHPSIVTIHEVDEAEGQLYIAMEYLPGRTLQALLEKEDALPLERALPILEQVADALDYAHGQGMVHRDVKPANIMVEETERGLQTTLMDFGLVKAMAGSSVLTSQGALLGPLVDAGTVTLTVEPHVTKASLRQRLLDDTSHSSPHPSRRSIGRNHGTRPRPRPSLTNEVRPWARRSTSPGTGSDGSHRRVKTGSDDRDRTHRPISRSRDG